MRLVSKKDDDDTARREDLKFFTADHGLPLIVLLDLIVCRRRTEKQVQQIAEESHPDGARHVLGRRMRQPAGQRMGLSPFPMELTRGPENPILSQ